VHDGGNNDGDGDVMMMVMVIVIPARTGAFARV
jgi:hypothetical protein